MANVRERRRGGGQERERTRTKILKNFVPAEKMKDPKVRGRKGRKGRKQAIGFLDLFREKL